MAASGVHTAVALVALPNPGSIALHKACGFEHVGTMREVGYKFDQWIDVEWYQKMLHPPVHAVPPARLRRLRPTSGSNGPFPGPCVVSLRT